MHSLLEKTATLNFTRDFSKINEVRSVPPHNRSIKQQQIYYRDFIDDDTQKVCIKFKH